MFVLSSSTSHDSLIAIEVSQQIGTFRLAEDLLSDIVVVAFDKLVVVFELILLKGGHVFLNKVPFEVVGLLENERIETFRCWFLHSLLSQIILSLLSS